jgi:acetyl-CoA carboxylase biotin carboxyl carrier protein
MDISRIEELAELMKKHGLAVLSLREGEVEIRLETGAGRPAREAQPAAPAQAPENGAQGGGSQNEIRSPMVGVFYSAGSPEGDPFVTIGQHVKKGDVLCVVEAMKLMNEITAERDCVISDICVENGQLVEYGQCLFKYI